MKKPSKMMLGLLERLAEMFPSQSYQSRLEAYLSNHTITDTAQLEHLIKQFDAKQGSYL